MTFLPLVLVCFLEQTKFEIRKIIVTGYYDSWKVQTEPILIKKIYALEDNSVSTKINYRSQNWIRQNFKRYFVKTRKCLYIKKTQRGKQHYWIG